MAISAVRAAIRRFRLIALLTLPCVFLGVLAASADAAPWLTSPNLSPPGGSGHPRVAVDASGDSVAVWTRAGSSETDLIEAAVKPLGSPWEAPVPISSSSSDAISPEVAIDSAGDAVAVWQIVVGSDWLIEAATRPAGGSWSSPEVLSQPVSSAVEPQVALDSAGDAAVVWEQVEGSSIVIKAAGRPAGGVWGAAQALSLPGQAQEPQVALDSAGDAVVVWDLESGPKPSIQTSSSVGGSWSAPETLSEAGQSAFGAQVAVNASGDSVAVWEVYDGSNFVIKSAGRAAGGAWGPVEDISVPGSESHVPRIALDSAGDAVAIWKDEPHALLASSRPTGGSWQVPSEISAAGEETEGVPALAGDPSGDAVALWSAWDGVEFIVRAASRSAGGAWESPPVELERSSEELFEADVAIAPSGNAVAVWRRSAGPESVIRSANQGLFLTVQKAGTGSGTVTSGPAGIGCGSTCESEFREGTVVTLTASAAAGSRFSGWSGDCSGSGACVVTMNEVKSVTAEFLPAASLPPAPASSVQSGCSLVRASAASFVPTSKPGKVVAGVRVKVSVTTPSLLQVSPTLTYRGKSGRSQSVALATRSLRVATARNLRMALPSSVRSRIPLGTKVGVSLQISAVPDSSPYCAPASMSKTLKLNVVDVLTAPQAGVS